MQKLYLNKLVDLNHQLKELISISVDESIHYQMENDGMRALGAIMINGEYRNDHDKYQFHESIDLDIIAPYDKIIDKREFHVKVEDFDYTFNDGNLSLVIQACIYGVKDDEDRLIEATQDDSDDEVVKEIENIMQNKEVLSKNIDIKNDYQKEDIKVFEDDDLDEDDLGTYYLYVIGDGDNYQNIAQRYHINEELLKKYNHNHNLSVGSIIIIPYVV
ncbi:MAG: LysM peptidoglycan-binding domain-containing protein [Erysipelotrichaceae bacterium]|nr:LysM peptidoglycan-binding domain-containing protein [Erysipelotrichaceae bacterium]